MGLVETLGVGSGVTAVVGSGGKTTLLSLLARELPGTVVLTTTTHIRPFPGVPLLVSPTADEVASALRTDRVACVGARTEGGKLTVPELGVEALAEIADFVLVEADGARRLPLKAHAAWEPVVPERSERTILVLGASGLDHPVHERVHRPELFCELAGCAPDDPATPGLVARAANAEALADVALVNQADVAPGRARELAALLAIPAAVGSLRSGDVSAPRG